VIGTLSSSNGLVHVLSTFSYRSEIDTADSFGFEFSKCILRLAANLERSFVDGRKKKPCSGHPEQGFELQLGARIRT